MSFYYLFATLPLYVLDLGGSNFQVGLIIGVFSVASLLTRPFFGAWMDLSGRKRFLLLGAGIYFVAALGYLEITSIPGLLLWRIFHATGLATFGTAAVSLAGDLARAGRRGTTMGLYGLAQAAALSVGPGVGAAILRTLDYRGLFLAAGLTALGALGCAMAVRETSTGGREASIRRPMFPERTIFRSIAVPAAFQFAASIAYGSIISFIAVVARERGLNVTGLFFVLLALSSLGIRLVAGRAYDAWGPRVVLVPSFLLLAIGMTILAVTVRARPFLAAAVFAGVGIGGAQTTTLARVVDRSPSGKRASAVAVFTSCWELGVGGGTVLMGLLAEVVGFFGMYLVAASLPLIGIGAAYWFQNHKA